MTSYHPPLCWCGAYASHVIPVDPAVTRPTTATRDDQPGAYVCPEHTTDGMEPLELPLCALCHRHVAPWDDARQVLAASGMATIHAHHPAGV